jgi:hypothetical protein
MDITTGQEPLWFKATCFVWKVILACTVGVGARVWKSVVGH